MPWPNASAEKASRSRWSRATHSEGVKALEAKQIRAKAFSADLSKPEGVRALIGTVREALGPVDAIHWNAYGSAGGDLLAANTDEVRAVFDLPVASLLAAVQTALPDLRTRKGALLVTNGGLGFFDPGADQAAVEWNAMGLAVANSAKHKLVALLARKLSGDEVYVGEVVVTGFVKGSAFDDGSATIDPKDIATKFWQLHAARGDVSATI
jgi:NADP-dependent 3-hydroxy acid dehydrogenase YdfG